MLLFAVYYYDRYGSDESGATRDLVGYLIAGSAVEALTKLETLGYADTVYTRYELERAGNILEEKESWAG